MNQPRQLPIERRYGHCTSDGIGRSLARRRSLAWIGMLGLMPLCTSEARGASAAPSTPESMPDVSLVDARGRKLRWRRDVLGDAPTIVNFVFTTCTSFCPLSSALMAQLQGELRSDAPLRFVSLSLDPLGDSPERLRDFAVPFAPGPRWTWLTGEPNAVYELLDAMRADPGGDPSTHAPLWLVGRAGRGPWQRVYDLPAVARFQALIDRLQ